MAPESRRSELIGCLLGHCYSAAIELGQRHHGAAEFLGHALQSMRDFRDLGYPVIAATNIY
jgi:hypothetical protein